MQVSQHTLEINTSWPADAYMRRRIGSSLVQIMAWWRLLLTDICFTVNYILYGYHVIVQQNFVKIYMYLE